MVAAMPSVHTPSFKRSVFAHRGLPTRAPENTIVSFTKACECGSQWLETDVDLLGDGTPVIIHDTDFDRTTDHAGRMYTYTSSDLAEIDAGGWYSPEFSGERIPTLDDFVDFLNSHHMNANIEIKQNEQGADRTRLLCEQIVGGLERLDEDRQIIISSFSQPLLITFHQIAPQYAIGVLYESAALYDDWQSVLELCGASYIHPEDTGLTRDKVKKFTDAGFGVNVWTVDEVSRANQLFNWGCTGVFTNVADQMQALATSPAELPA